MSGFEIAGLVLAIPSILVLINRTVVAIKGAKKVPKGVLELLEVIRTDIERLSELSREHGGFFANPTIRDSVQGLHEQPCSDLEAVLRRCETKYLRKRSLWNKVQKILSGGDVDGDLTRMHQKIQKAYYKWMFEITLRTNGQVGGLEVQLQGLENKLDDKSSSVRSGTGQSSEDRGKKGKSSRKTKPRSLRMHAKHVGLSDAEAGRKHGNVEV